MAWPYLGNPASTVAENGLLRQVTQEWTRTKCSGERGICSCGDELCPFWRGIAPPPHDSCGLFGFGLGVDFQHNVDDGAVVELAHGFCSALAVLELRVDFVIDGGLKRRKTIAAVRSDDVGFDRSRVRVGQVDHGMRLGA